MGVVVTFVSAFFFVFSKKQIEHGPGPKKTLGSNRKSASLLFLGGQLCLPPANAMRSLVDLVHGNCR